MGMGAELAKGLLRRQATIVFVWRDGRNSGLGEKTGSSKNGILLIQTIDTVSREFNKFFNYEPLINWLEVSFCTDNTKRIFTCVEADSPKQKPRKSQGQG